MLITKINKLNAAVLIIMGLWGYVEVSSPTALIPVIFGIIIGLLTFTSEKKPTWNTPLVIAVAILTGLILVALTGMRLPKSLDSGGAGLIRVIAMMSTSTIAILGIAQHLLSHQKK